LTSLAIGKQMVRKCERLKLKEVFKKAIYFPLANVDLYVDVENQEEIIAFIKKYEKKSRRIYYEMYSLRYNHDLYGKEVVSKIAKNVTAMKYKGKKYKNSRIYCKEYLDRRNNRKKVVMVTLHKNKKGQMSRKNKALIERIGGCKYEF